MVQDLEQKTKEHYEFRLGDFIPIFGLFKYANRTYNHRINTENWTVLPEEIGRQAFLAAYNVPFVAAGIMVLSNYLK